MSKISPVILCGGSGTRLWPRSRAICPKPFLPLVGETTLFEATLARASDPALFGAAVVVTGAAHLEHVEAQIGSDPAARIIVEPAARNTAAAIARAAAVTPGVVRALIDEGCLVAPPADDRPVSAQAIDSGAVFDLNPSQAAAAGEAYH